MSDPERNKVVYVTADSSKWAILDIPFGMIMPPMIDLHVPQVGTETFYCAEMYQLKVPSAVAKASRP
jgi:hypothetical protein